MNTENYNRKKLTTEWFFQDWIGETIHLPEPEDVFNFLKVLMDISSTMLGELTEQERKYILGKAAVFGASDDHLNKLQIYQPNANMIDEEFHLPHIQKSRTGIIYNLFRMLEFSQEKFNVIYIIGNKLGLVEKQIREIENFFEEEDILRQKRAKILFPNGFADVLKGYENLRLH